MDAAELFSTALIIALAGLILFVANRDTHSGKIGLGLRWLLYSAIAANFLIGASGVLNTFAPPPPTSAQETVPPVAGGIALLAFAIAAVSSLSALLILHLPLVRGWLRGRIAETNTYDTLSPMHTTALVLMFVFFSSNLVGFLLAGGIEGASAALEQNGISFEALFVQQALWVFIALMGVGLFMRRTLPATLERLGLRAPGMSDFIAGGAAAIIGYGLVLIAGIAWTLISNPELIEQQTAASRQFALAFDSIPLAFAIAVAVGIGEEILFRGALQPVFGNILTSIFFTFMHTQYGLTPPTLVIFIVSIGFGYLRQRYSTTSAIFAHFLYNFIQLALAVLASRLLDGLS
jgi:membrane protease YdiL (CAAX protease family)